jgi:hypothetical protein
MPKKPPVKPVKIRSKTGKKLIKLANSRPQRNNAFFDGWSIIHLLTGVIMGWVMSPFIALLLMILWEPLEILVLSPILAKFGIIFGYETLRNSLSDIVFDIVGVIIGAYILTALLEPPFFLF